MVVRKLMRCTPALPVALALAACLGAGCASDDAGHWDKARQAREAARKERPSVVQQAKYEDDAASPEMKVTGEEGTLNTQDIDAALQDHFGEIRECLRIGRRSLQRATGRLVMRFFVDAKGEVEDVAILESSIGDHLIERCIADIGLGVTFERPAGGKPTTFDYPVELRSAHPVTASRQRGH
jgi:hypothetical protein